jgi:hypothetical protein
MKTVRIDARGFVSKAGRKYEQLFSHEGKLQTNIKNGLYVRWGSDEVAVHERFCD